MLAQGSLKWAYFQAINQSEEIKMIVSQIQLCHKETIIQARSLKINSLLPTFR